MECLELELSFAVACCALHKTPAPPATPTRLAEAQRALDGREETHDSTRLAERDQADGRAKDVDGREETHDGTHGACWLALVPDAVLLMALSHVTDAAEHSRVAATCRRLHRLMRGTRVRSLSATPRLRRMTERATCELLRRLCGGACRQGCLTHLDLSGVGLRSLEFRLSQLAFPRLDGLTLHKCEQLTGLVGIAQLAPGLTKLDLSGCTELASLEGIGGLTSLRALSVTGCVAVTQWQALSTCPVSTQAVHLLLVISRCFLRD